MDVRLSHKLKREIAGVSEYGYSNAREFIEDAVRHHIFELKSGVKLTPGQRRDLDKSREEMRKGDYVTLQELAYEMGIENKKDR